jgi:hypothetical protein
MRTQFLLPLSIVLALAAPSTRLARAGMIQGVGIQSVSSQQTGTTDQRTATNLVNGVGLFGNAHGDSVNGDMWLTSANTAGAYSNAYVVFDLGSMHTLQKVKVYNYNERGGTPAATGRGVQRADIQAAGDDLAFTNVIAGQTFNKGPATDNVTDFGQTITLNNLQARYIRLNVITNYGGSGDYKVGLSKVLFYDNTVPPIIKAATRNYSSNQVTVIFSEVVNAASALNTANYQIKSGGQSVTISSAKLDAFGDRVMLTTAPLTSPACTVTAANILADSDGVSITNTTVTVDPELAVWLKADAGVTADGSGFVSAWADQSGNGNDALQSLAALQPTLAASSMNGKPSIRFTQSGTTSTNTLAIADSPTMRINRDITVMMVVQVDANNVNNELLSRTIANRAAPFDYYFQNLSSGVGGRFYRGNQGSGGGAFGYVGATNNFPASQVHVVTIVTQGTNGMHYLDGLFNGSALLPVGVEDARTPTLLGWRVDNGLKLNGNIAEVLLFRGALSDYDRVTLSSQLGAKYGVSIVDIIITSQPQNATAVEGRTATFTVAAQASSSSIGYQWQRNNVNISNATNATYTTPTLSQANNGDTYRVLVSIPGASKFSDAAVLSVQADTQKPTLTYAGRSIWNSNQVVVVFSEPVSVATATVAANYVLDQGAHVSTAAMGDVANKVVLSVSGFVNGTTYTLTVQNVKDSFNNTLDTVQQTVGLYPHLALWLKADAGVSADGSGNVSAWSDQSGNANDAFAPAQGPLLVANGFNGKPVLRYDGTNAYLAANHSASLAIVADLAICAVMQFTDYSDANGNEICGKTGGTKNNIPAPYDFYAGPGTGRLRFYRGNGTTYQNVTSTAAPTPGAPHVLLANMAGTAATQFLDGAANGSNQITVAITDAGGPLGVGTRMDLALKTKGDMAELMICDQSLSDGDGAALQGYLGTKYGIAIATTVTPSLSTAVTTQGLVLSWPVPTQAFTLESAPNLVSGPWTTVANTVTTANGTNSVTVPMSQSAQFFRLHKQ